MRLFNLFRFIFRLPWTLIRIYHEIKLSGNNNFRHGLLFITYLKLIFLAKTNDQECEFAMVKIHDYKVKGRSYSSILFLYKEIFINQTYFIPSLPPYSLIVDCGSNIGMSILYFRSIYPQCSILGFEPDSETYRLLHFNISNNNLQNVSIYQKALGLENDTIKYYQNQARGGLTSSVFMNRDTFQKVTEVECVRLSDFITEEIPELIKIDVEGAEFFIIEDLMEKNIFSKQRRFIIEYHHKINNTKSKLSEFLQYLENNGFEYSLKANYKKESLSQDILIYVFAETK